ncbi:restriction endonuclease subunit S [Wohlfahrtiimonas chitiniclastica]|uniref:restriction endonuclease subunit S n=1 Tax=Wohlfahrtiimonas chitiniclastica TaxID=400946 RepID=UPI00248B2771|nr:restriction endonuclease subunit S [Wohlfahrtiimonas chitiniclastica]
MMDIKSKFLDEILNCPDVEWKSLGDIAEIGTGCSNRQDENLEGKYPFYVRSENILRSESFQFDETAIIIPGEGGIGDIFHYINGKYALHQRAYRIHVIEDDIICTKFLYYFMRSFFKQYILSKSVGATSISIRKPMLEQFVIPIPPLPIQQKIVDILDKFTKLTAELTAELTARKQQYEYYRDELLTFGDDVEWKELGEIAEYSTERISFNELNEENYVGVDNLLQDKMGKRNSNHVPIAGNSTKFYKKDILIGNIRPYLKKIWFADCTGGTNGDVLVIHTTDIKIDPQYLYQVLADDKFFDYNMQHARGAKMPRGNKAEILKYPIPIPSLNEQARIVGILDKFDALTNSITEGLPREIELRQQQYEYYRDLLLSFPKPDGVK